MNAETNNDNNIVAVDAQESHVDASFASWREKFLSNPENRAVYEQVAREKEIWLQLQEARKREGLTQKQVAERMGVSQAQVARLEKEGYNNYSINSIQRYAQALSYDLNLSLQKRAKQELPDNVESLEGVRRR